MDPSLLRGYLERLERVMAFALRTLAVLDSGPVLKKAKGFALGP